MNDAVIALSANRHHKIVSAATTVVATTFTSTPTLSLAISSVAPSLIKQNTNLFTQISDTTIVTPSSMTAALNNFNTTNFALASGNYYGVSNNNTINYEWT